MDSFDKKFDDLASPPKPAPAEPAATPPKDKPPEKDAAPTKPETPEKATDEGDDFAAPQSATLIQVRQWGRRMADMAKQAQKKTNDLNARIQELEQKAPTMPPDVDKLQTGYEQAQKTISDLRERLARADYTQDPSYETEFKQPYADAYHRGRNVVQTLLVREPDGINEDTGEQKFKTRNGNVEDFDRLYNMTDSEADAASDAMFGPSSHRVKELRDKVRAIAERAHTELAKKAAEHQEELKTRQAQEAQQRVMKQGLWKKFNDDLQSKHSEWFGQREDDKEWNEALAKGTDIARQRFTDAYMKMSPEEQVMLDAQIFNRSRAFTPMKGLITKLQAELVEAKKTIETMRDSGPGKPTPGAIEKDTGADGDWEKAGEKAGVF